MATDHDVIVFFPCPQPPCPVVSSRPSNCLNAKKLNMEFAVPSRNEWWQETPRGAQTDEQFSLVRVYFRHLCAGNCLKKGKRHDYTEILSIITERRDRLALSDVGLPPRQSHFMAPTRKMLSVDKSLGLLLHGLVAAGRWQGWGGAGWWMENTLLFCCGGS